MIPSDFPKNWYWLADDGRLYASARQAVVADDDEAYLAWCAAGRIATRWPQDDGGQQTIAALQEVLTPHGLCADLSAYIAMRRWQREVEGVFVPIGGELVAVSTARGDDRAALHQAYSAIRDGLRRDGATFNFADGRPRSVANTEMMAAIRVALDHVQAAFDLGGEILASYKAGEITSHEQIDAAFS